jgi:surface polysaccharide O-acyltransferase-like enzyme
MENVGLVLVGTSIYTAHPSAPAVAGQIDRNGAVDIARFAGAIGIVWFHEHAPFAWLGYAALPMFVAFLLYFALATSDRAGSDRRRGTRLLLPWVAWSVIYGAANVADALVSGAPLASEFDYWMLLTGPKIHLWFLPFAFFAGWGLIVLLPIIRRHCSFAVLWLLFAAVQAGLFFVLSEYSFGRPFYQWLFVVPAVFLGLMLHLADGDRIRLLSVAVAAALACWLAVSLGWQHGAMQTLIATSVCAAVLMLPLAASPVTDLLARISLGIYLVHPLISALLKRLPGAEPETLGFAASVAALSVLVAIIMKQLPGFRRIV